MEIMVEEDLEKSLHSVMAMWKEEDDAKNKGVEKGNNDEAKICQSESEGEQEEGYSSYMDLRKMPSKRWSRDARRNSDKNTELQMMIGAGNMKMKSAAMREMEPERRKLGKKGDDGIGGVDVSPAKNTRSSTQGRKEK